MIGYILTLLYNKDGQIYRGNVLTFDKDGSLFKNEISIKTACSGEYYFKHLLISEDELRKRIKFIK